MHAHELRVFIEAKELEEKINDLTSFQTTAIFESLSEEERELLLKQSDAMKEYLSILNERINILTRLCIN